MVTFLPFTNYKQCAECLDLVRLNKQILEVNDILTGKFPYHPISLMWKKYHKSLNNYGYYMVNEYENRTGKRHSFHDKFMYYNTPLPDWLDNKIIISHRVNLLRKDYAHYSKYFKVKKPVDYYPKSYYWPICKPGSYADLCSKEWEKVLIK